MFVAEEQLSMAKFKPSWQGLCVLNQAVFQFLKICVWDFALEYISSKSIVIMMMGSSMVLLMWYISEAWEVHRFSS